MDCGAPQGTFKKSKETVPASFNKEGKPEVQEDREAVHTPAKSEKVKIPTSSGDVSTTERKVKKAEPETEQEENDEVEVDFSKIDPRTDWACFGQIEPEHIECKGCPYRKECAVEAGVTL